MSFKEFLVKNSLNSYERMVAYCDRRGVIPPESSYYDKHVETKVETKKVVVKEEKGAKDVKPKQPAKRSASQTQKKQAGRPRTRKVKKS